MLTSKQLLKIVLLDGTSLDTVQNVPDLLTSQSFQTFLVSMSYNNKNVKNEDIWICSISPTAMVLKVINRFLISDLLL